ncbi:hypothetical protein LOSG293_050130 [Secundilactobacillus oryzae JCM 18671]|uniref:Uncharacterized protein n=1 Tax=Secundilactobacillus oryzae JCM 18671 TaxID=1291743 RepID=A0A081BH25_9LACO|nr:hypothetical protein LOSG293_050130 [Secundilactobacillus oryzae JCM 18671]
MSDFMFIFAHFPKLSLTIYKFMIQLISDINMFEEMNYLD